MTQKLCISNLVLERTAKGENVDHTGTCIMGLNNVYLVLTISKRHTHTQLFQKSQFAHIFPAKYSRLENYRSSLLKYIFLNYLLIQCLMLISSNNQHKTLVLSSKAELSLPFL